MPPTSQSDPRTIAITNHLSTPRLGPFLAASKGNLRDALRLYQWNIDLSGAAYESLHMFEVVLRNVMDEQLCIWNASQIERGSGRSHSRDWLMDPSHLLSRLTGTDIGKASIRARAALRTGRHGGRQPAHPDVLAQLNFGTWRFLLPGNDAGRQLLWAQSLRFAFPHLTDSPASLVRQVNGIYRMRNRVAHLEPLLRSGTVRQEFNGMRSVLTTIDPSVEQWFTSRQRVTQILKKRP